jgi:hypothetical protein
MIVVRLKGGLGNQMFQYAAARAIAVRRSTVVKLDCRFYASQSKRRYELDKLRIIQRFPNALERFMISSPEQRRAKVAARVMAACWPRFRINRVLESGFTFDRTVMSRAGSLYLDGYWQSPKYFAEIASLLRHEFAVKTPPNPQNASMMSEIESCSSICLHVRRGDYVSDPRIQEFHGTCGVEYYRKALEEVAARVTVPVVFVFSDDPAWVKQHLVIDRRVVYVTHNIGHDDHEDLRLMTHCKHFILANSTFGWWGAWLANNPRKIVICPNRWFAAPAISAADLIPHEWIRI